MAATTTGLGSGPFTDMISSIDRRCEFVENQAGANVRVNNFLTPTTLDDKSSILNAPCGYSNGVYASLRPVQTFGPELITNGDFATDSNWTKGTGWSIANGKASRTSQSGSTACDQSISLIAGKKYKIVYTLTISAGSFNVRFSGTTNVNGLSRTTSGTYVDYLVAATGNNTFRLVGANGSFVGSIDNVSVKEATDADFDFARGSAATRVTKDGLIKNVQILSDDLVQNGNFEQIGSELITNGDFATDSDWAKGGGATISNGKGNIIGDGTSFTYLQQYNVFTVGKFYKVTLDAVINSGLGLKVQDGSTNANFGVITTSGTYTFYGKANNSGFVIGRRTPGTAFDSYVDNVSVKEVGQNWSFGTGWSINDGKAIKTGTVASNFDQLNTGVFTNNKTYKITFNVSNSNNGRLLIYIGGNSVTIDITNATNGTHTFYGIADGEDYLIFRNDTSGFEGSIDNVSVIEITDDTNLPRIDYTGGTGSLLLEPQRTNRITYSEQIGTGISVVGLNIDNSQTTSPEGLVNAAMLTTTATSQPRLESGVDYNSTYAISCFIKKNIGDYFGFGYYEAGTGNGFVRFNISNGLDSDISYEGTTLSNGKIESFNDNWYRISAKITTGSSTGKSGAKFVAMKSDAFSLSDIGNKYYIYGLQLEEASYATSYIPTSGSTVTRNADVCNNAGSSDLINSTEGVLYAEIARNEGDTIATVLSLNDGSNSNTVSIYYFDTNRVGFDILSTSPNVVSSFVISNTYDFNKIALKYKSGDISLWINGIEVYTNTSTITLSGLNSLDFKYANGTFPFYGKVKSVAVFKEALTDEELAKITSVTQQEAFYEMRDKMLQINADYYEFGDYTTRLKKLF